MPTGSQFSGPLKEVPKVSVILAFRVECAETHQPHERTGRWQIPPVHPLGESPPSCNRLSLRGFRGLNRRFRIKQDPVNWHSQHPLNDAAGRLWCASELGGLKAAIEGIDRKMGDKKICSHFSAPHFSVGIRREVTGAVGGEAEAETLSAASTTSLRLSSRWREWSGQSGRVRPRTGLCGGVGGGAHG